MSKDMVSDNIQLRNCHFCNSVEGKARPVGDYIVELTLTLLNEESILVCQSCFRKRIRSQKDKMKKNKLALKTFAKLKLLMSKMFALLFFSMISFTTAAFQPGLPSPPSEAPIDGGLGLLAAAGGAYAIKKLRNKK